MMAVIAFAIGAVAGVIMMAGPIWQSIQDAKGNNHAAPR